ncbi:MAG: hypothetical protein ACI9G1_003328 [Pirellulaceae bacterium]
MQHKLNTTSTRKCGFKIHFNTNPLQYKSTSIQIHFNTNPLQYKCNANPTPDQH